MNNKLIKTICMNYDTHYMAAIAGMTANTAPAGQADDGQADDGTKVEIVKANLQKLANVTSHKKDDAKFDMAIVKDAKLADYRDALLAEKNQYQLKL